MQVTSSPRSLAAGPDCRRSLRPHAATSHHAAALSRGLLGGRHSRVPRGPSPAQAADDDVSVPPGPGPGPAPSGRGFGTPAPKAPAERIAFERPSTSERRGPRVITPAVDAARAGPSPDLAFETNYVRALGVLFAIIIGLGLLLAVSGFLPQEIDDFTQKVVYPGFTPILAVFLLASTFYGIIKTGGLNQFFEKKD